MILVGTVVKVAINQLVGLFGAELTTLAPSSRPVDAQRDGFDLALQDQAGGQAVQAARQPFRGVVAAHLA